MNIVVHYTCENQGNTDSYRHIGKGKTQIVKQGRNNPLVVQYPDKIPEPHKTNASKTLHRVPSGKTKEKRKDHREYDEYENTKKIWKNKKISRPFFLPLQNAQPMFWQYRMKQRNLLGNEGDGTAPLET
jgi:hypothetical protein